MKDSDSKRLLIINLIFIAFVWFLLFSRLYTEWVVNSLYSYGWFVPVLAGFLFHERWRDRPPNAAERPHPAWLFLPAAIVLLYFPLRVINEANPDWVKVNFLLTISIVVFMLGAVYSFGRFRSVWHFAFPILFVFTAMPWPVWFEDTIVQTLTRWNTDVSAESLTLCGTPAIASGNLISVGGTWVNVAEACSGIRSLQTAFMMSLFLGEFYRLRFPLRTLLMGSSFIVVFALNVGRTMTLTYIAGTDGNATMEKWHDPLGNAVMVLGLLSLWLLALGFEKFQGRFWRRSPSTKTAAVLGSPAVPAPFPLAFVVSAFVFLVGSEVATESWYRYHEKVLPPPAEWSLQWPQSMPNFKTSELPDRTRAILKYNSGESASWTTTEGFRWSMYYIRWLPGRVSKFLSGAHYPTVCLPASGLKFVNELGKYHAPIGKTEIPFTCYLFASGSQSLYVFHAIVEDQPAQDGEKVYYKQVDTDARIDSILRGHRNLGQRVIGISVSGPISLEEAQACVRNQLAEILSITPKTP